MAATNSKPRSPSPPRPAPPPASATGTQTGEWATRDALNKLEQGIQALRVEFERFFNGALPVPPLELKDRLQAALRRLRDRPMTNLADRFRLQQLEARFNAYSELQNRRLRDREEGRAAAPSAPAAGPQFDLAEGVVLDTSLHGEAVEALYLGLVAGGNGARFDLDSFRSYLAQQVATLRGKTGCEEVRFRLVEEDGQTRLKAKPIKAV